VLLKSGLIRGVALGESGLIRGGLQGDLWWEWLYKRVTAVLHSYVFQTVFFYYYFFFTFFHVLTEILDKNTDIDGDLLQTFLVDIFTFQF
jgi:hypothetical protein